MIRCLIVDDEEVARQHVARLLKAFPDVIEVGQASNAPKPSN
jgi:DNA-binding LytR/AlgR family response regulator